MNPAQVLRLTAHGIYDLVRGALRLAPRYIPASGAPGSLALITAHLWHPFTQMALWADDAPLIIERAEGNWLIDTLGRRWLDAALAAGPGKDGPLRSRPARGARRRFGLSAGFRQPLDVDSPPR